ncbi:MAG TPA: hypothetical protein DEQ80_00995 [Anaerolinea thermolimosa]|uniref:O-antigen ligase-related domain-containing protein n=1 Tax=Anaerolinea thermolimosa TaxID=229919 RepID=A0A3D1JD09_9CHLR|nr:hypothetical protein [Anaerolinea thermolimosa]
MKALRRAAYAVLEAEPWVVGALALAGVVEERFLLAAVGAAVLFWLLGLLAGVRRASLGAAWPIAGLAGLAALQAGVSPLPERSQLEGLRLLAWVGVFLALGLWVRTRRRVNLAVAGLALLGLALAGAALFTVNWTDRKLPFIPIDFLMRLPRLGERVHPNVMAGALVVLVPFLGAWWLFNLRRLGWAGALGLGGVLLIMSGVVVLTKSRAGYLGLAGGVALLPMLRWKRAGSALVLGAGLLAGVLFFSPSSPLPREMLFGSSLQTALQGREDIWRQAAFLLRHFPLTGVGLGCFGPASDVLAPVPGGVKATPHAHNLFLQVGAELGWPGVILWAGVMLALVVEGCLLYRSSAPWQGLGAGLLASLLAMNVHGIWDAVTWGTRMAFVPWLIWGVCCGARQILPDRLKQDYDS